jgi:feruloyl esterase
MGRPTVDAFARLLVLPQTNHGLRGNVYTTDGEGKTIPTAPIPATFNRLALIQAWAERNEAPGMSITVTSGDRSLPLCSYPAYPKYNSGPPAAAASYTCAR